MHYTVLFKLGATLGASIVLFTLVCTLIEYRINNVSLLINSIATISILCFLKRGIITITDDEHEL